MKQSCCYSIISSLRSTDCHIRQWPSQPSMASCQMMRRLDFWDRVRGLGHPSGLAAPDQARPVAWQLALSHPDYISYRRGVGFNYSRQVYCLRRRFETWVTSESPSGKPPPASFEAYLPWAGWIGWGPAHCSILTLDCCADEWHFIWCRMRRRQAQILTCFAQSGWGSIPRVGSGNRSGRCWSQLRALRTPTRRCSTGLHLLRPTTLQHR